MTERADFYVCGQPFDGGPLHYTACGLDYVYLLNGFTVEDDPEYGRLITIQHEDGLHKAIGLYIIEQDRDLTGPEFRFLRKQMGLTQAELAKEFRVDVQTIANYEKGKSIPGTAQQYMRMTFALWMILPPDTHASVIKELAQQARRSKRRQAPKRDQERVVREWRECGGAQAAHVH